MHHGSPSTISSILHTSHLQGLAERTTALSRQLAGAMAPAPTTSLALSRLASDPALLRLTRRMTTLSQQFSEAAAPALRTSGMLDKLAGHHALVKFAERTTALSRQLAGAMGATTTSLALSRLASDPALLRLTRRMTTLSQQFSEAAAPALRTSGMLTAQYSERADTPLLGSLRAVAVRRKVDFPLAPVGRPIGQAIEAGPVDHTVEVDEEGSGVPASWRSWAPEERLALVVALWIAVSVVYYSVLELSGDGQVDYVRHLLRDVKPVVDSVFGALVIVAITRGPNNGG